MAAAVTEITARLAMAMEITPAKTPPTIRVRIDVGDETTVEMAMQLPMPIPPPATATAAATATAIPMIGVSNLMTLALCLDTLTTLGTSVSKMPMESVGTIQDVLEATGATTNPTTLNKQNKTALRRRLT